MAAINKSILLAIILFLSFALLSCVATLQDPEAEEISKYNIPFEIGELNFTVEQIQIDFLEMDEIRSMFVFDTINDMILLAVEVYQDTTQVVINEFIFLYDIIRQEIIAKIDMSGADRLIADALIFGDMIIYVDKNVYRSYIKAYDITSGQQTIIRTIQSPWRSEPQLRRVEGGYLVLYIDLELSQYGVEFVSHNQEIRILYKNSLEYGEPFSPGNFQAFGDRFAFFEAYQGNEYFFIGNTNGEYQKIQLTKHVDNFSILAQGLVTSHAYIENEERLRADVIRYLEFVSFDGQTTARLDGFRTFRKTTNGNAILGIADWITEEGYHFYGRPMLIRYANESLYAYLINFHEAVSVPHFVAVDDNTWFIVSGFPDDERGIDVGVFKLKVE